MDFSCLAVETSTAAPSLALLHGGLLIQRTEPGLRLPSRVIYEWLQDLLAEARCGVQDLDCIAFGAGPGSFTGTRIAVAMAQGLGYATGRPLCQVSSLAAMAAGVMRDAAADHVACCLDARLGEVYVGLYHRGDGGAVRAVAPDALLAPDEVELPGDAGWVVAGSGPGAFPELKRRLGGRIVQYLPDALPDAGDVALLAQHQFMEGDVVGAAHAAPNYLRVHVASLPAATTTGSR